MSMYLSSPGEFKPSPEVLNGRPREVSGQPASYFWKELIKTGEYVNEPRKFELSVPDDRIKGWAKTGKAMLAAGVRIPIVCDHSEKARDAVGNVIDFKADASGLLSLCQFIGPDAPLLAARNDVSVGIREKFIDGSGRDWGDAITHVALTPVPVVGGLDPFIAASRSDDSDPVLLKLKAASRVAADDVPASIPATTPNSGGTAMYQCSLSPEQLEKFKKLVPGGDTLTPETLHEKLLHAMSQSETQRLMSLNTDLTTQVREMSAKMPKPMDPDAEALVIDSAKVKFDSLAARGAITPAVKDKLLSLLVTDGTKNNTIALSRSSNPQGDKPLAFAIADALVDNKPVAPGTATGLQTLSRSVPDEGEADAEKRKKDAQDMLNKHLGVKKEKAA